jgi:hypothetical protein
MKLITKLLSLVFSFGCVPALVHSPHEPIPVASSSQSVLPDSELVQRIKYAGMAVLGTIVKTERNWDFEESCSFICKLRGGKEPPHWYLATVRVDSTVDNKGVHHRDGQEYIAYAVIISDKETDDSMPGKGLHAIFLVRYHYWVDYGKYRASRAWTSAYIPYEPFWSLASWKDVLSPSMWSTIVSLQSYFDTEKEPGVDDLPTP